MFKIVSIVQREIMKFYPYSRYYLWLVCIQNIYIYLYSWTYTSDILITMNSLLEMVGRRCFLASQIFRPSAFATNYDIHHYTHPRTNHRIYMTLSNSWINQSISNRGAIYSLDIWRGFSIGYGRPMDFVGYSNYKELDYEQQILNNHFRSFFTSVLCFRVNP